MVRTRSSLPLSLPSQLSPFSPDFRQLLSFVLGDFVEELASLPEILFGKCRQT
jgi:hypothetical protein